MVLKQPKEPKIEIHVPRKRGKLDPIFYCEYVEIATCKASDGTKFALFPNGEVDITIGKPPGREYRYRNQDLFEGIRRHKLTDRKLKKLAEENKIFWEMNNWFEIEWLVPGWSKRWECELGLVASDYDDGIQMLKDVVRDYENKEGHFK